MKKIILIVFVVLLFNESAFAENFYCPNLDPLKDWSKIYDPLRKADYWGKIYFFISDYNDEHNGDVVRLGLISGNKGIFDYTPSSELWVHFEEEFKRIVKKELPYHDVEVGENERFKAFSENYIKNGNAIPRDFDKFTAEFQATEESRRKALYGSFPIQLICKVAVSKEEVFVLYVMECGIALGAHYGRNNILGYKKLGYSTPEFINKELKNTTTKILEKLGKDLNEVRNCSQN